ncbi:calcium channel protein [Haplosporangium sp. Z 11]|nr:calcium channel protein [Haplosporangium sp. Z 11]
MPTIYTTEAHQNQVAEVLEDSGRTQTSAVSSTGGQRYKSLRNENQGLDNDTENDPSGLSPNAAAVGSAWARLARRESDQSSTRGQYELNPINDRTGLTSNRPSFTAREDSQEDLLSGGDPAFNVHLEPPETQPQRKRGFHHKHLSNASADSSLRPKPTRSTAPGSRLASMKQVLGRASTRVVNLNGSSRSQPPVPEIASIYSRRSSDDGDDDEEEEEEEEEQETQESHESAHPTAAEVSVLKDAVRISRTSLIPDAQESNPQPVSMDQPSPDPPLEGKTLFIFGPENPFRKRINRFLNQTWVELFLLLLLVINLAFLIAKMSSPKGSDTLWGHWTDYGLLVVFVLYTIEIASRIIVSGLILYPKDGDKIRKLFGKKQRTDNLHDTNPTILRKGSNAQKRQSTMTPAATFRHTDQVVPTSTAAAARATTIIDFAVGHKTTVTQFIPTSMDPLIAYRPQFVAAPGTQIPYLRHTFNRIDFIAVLCYWIDFALMMAGVHNVYVFKTIAAMRTLRLLNITSGSATILHSLKKSAPLLVNIVLFIAFFFIIFSIIGVQAFKGSMSRRCVWASDEKEVLDQYCGGHYNSSDQTEELSYIMKNGEVSPTSPKGHICSLGYICKDTGINFDKVISYDVIYSAMVPVYVLMTGQTWTDLMYKIMDAEYAWSSIYFVLVVLVMNFWILNLFVAVINEMFAKIRDDSSHNSAFTSDSSMESKNAILNESINNFTYAAAMFSRRKKWIEALECQRVVGGWIGLLNLIFFIAAFLGVVSVMAGILFREIITDDESLMTFSDFYVSYLGMYQLFSGENWTDIMYNVISVVLVNMLIAIIMENFEGGAEVAKHTQQILDFAAKSGYSKEEERKFVIYLTKYLKPYPKSIGVDPLQSGWIYRMRKGLARQFLLGDTELFHGAEMDPLLKSSVDRKKNHHRRMSSQKTDYDFTPFQKRLSQDEIDDTEHFRKLFAAHVQGYEEMDSPRDPIAKKTPFFSAEAFRQRSLLIFGPENKIRRFLQQFVTPGRGYRLHGKRENKMLSRPFNLFITLAILACVIVAAITTPAWRLREYGMAPEDQSLVVRISDYVFPAIFSVEFLVRAIADGFIFTPDAYLRTFWNKIDFFVLLTLYAPLVADVTNSQGTSRFFRSLKALRALRLINQSDYIRGTFHAVLVAGFPQLFDATMLSMSLIVPFAIYGMRLFSGLFYGCNDTDETILSINDCVGTYDDAGFLKPRVWSNPYVYSFDNFGSSFLILFEIVSQEGWTGVMESARNITGLGMQPRADASRYNAIFFVLYNLAGGYFVSALFVAIVIENYTKRTGTAFMTANQRRWMDLKKLLGGIKMSKARSIPPNNRLRQICHQIASPKRGWFARLLTIVTILNGVVLATEHVNAGEWEEIKNWVFLTLLSVYIMEIVFKIGGLGWNVYRKNWWNVYNGTVAICAFLITIMRVCGSSWQPLIQTQKLFLTAILFRLVPRSDSLNQLFMTMAASIGSISSLLGVWLVVFAVYGIMFVEIFGLTAYGPNGSDNVNFRHIGTSLLAMARMSTGEGWNDLMHDFAMEKPDCVNQPNNYLLSDCGSTAWAYALFISFNIISMYIFTNMFIVVVMHNFSYVYQIAPGFSLITREEIRGFKRVWAMIDKDHTGYIQEKDLARFLMNLRGVFDVRVYNEEHSLIKLQSRLETAKPNPVKLSARDLEKNTVAGSNPTRKVLMLNETRRRSTFNMDMNGSKEKDSGPGAYGKKSEPRPNLLYKLDQDYNLAAFNSAIANLDKVQVKWRRRLYNFLYTEVLMSMEPIPGTESRKKKRFFHWRAGSLGGAGQNADGDFEMGEVGTEMVEAQQGISFQKMLTILAHYKLIEDDQCLSIGDMLRHRQKMDRIHAHMNVASVRSVLLKFILRRRFLKHYSAVQRIQALASESSSSGDSGNPPSGGSGAGRSSVGAGVRSISLQHVPHVAHSSHSSDSPEQSASGGRQRMRINTGEDQNDATNSGSSSNASNPREWAGRRSVTFTEGEKTAIEEEEFIDPAQANIMINNLRAEWRAFISEHGLSLTGDRDTSQIGDEPPRLPSLGDFDYVDLSGSTSGSGQQGGSTQQPRKEVLGFDYL